MDEALALTGRIVTPMSRYPQKHTTVEVKAFESSEGAAVTTPREVILEA